jgi:hypothetical protein
MKRKYVKSFLSLCLAGAVTLSSLAGLGTSVYASAVSDFTIEESDINQLLYDDLELPTSVDGAADATIEYSLEDGTNSQYVTLEGTTLKITQPYAGEGNYTFNLKAKVTNGTEVTEKTFPLTIAEGTSDDTYAGYAYISFAAVDGYDVQQLHLFLSEDGLNWTAVNGLKPLFTVGTDYADDIEAAGTHNYTIKEGTDISTTTTGDASVLFPFEGDDQGVRDPYMIRGCKADGSDSGKVWILATDLNTQNSKYGGNLTTHTVGNWGTMSQKGSTSLFIYETEDWVHWTRRYVDVGSEIGAGAAWAPEAIYNPEKDNYLVYWSCRVSTDGYTRNRLYCNETSDFVTFGPTKMYEEEPFYENHTTASDGAGNIDTSQLWVADEDGNPYGTLYRLVKDEANNHVELMSADTVLDPTVDYDSTDPNRITPYTLNGTSYSLLSDITSLGSTSKSRAEIVYNWFIDESVGNHFTKISQKYMEAKTGAYEGATMFKFNDRDEWCIMIDYYGSMSVRYEPYTTTDLSEPDSITKLTSGYGRTGGDVGTHGGMIPITAAEYNEIIDTYNSDPTVDNYHEISYIQMDNRELADSVEEVKEKLEDPTGLTDTQVEALKDSVTSGEIILGNEEASSAEISEASDRIQSILNPDTVEISEDSVSISSGKSETVTAKAATGATVTWKSGDTSVATVDENGKITAVGKGTTLVFAKVGKTGIDAIKVTVE